MLNIQYYCVGFIYALWTKKTKRYRKLNEEDDNYFLLSSHTLSKTDKKKHGHHTGTMKPMSAHDEKTLATAVALANEITTKSMNDLDGEPNKLPNSPSERSKFHFKFPQLSLHNNTPHEAEKDAAGKHERRNFTEEANSVPDIQSIITEESKHAYTSLIEQPATCSSVISHITPHGAATMPKPAPRGDATQFHSLQKHHSRSARSAVTESNRNVASSSINELPLPPRNTKPKLVDKPRHIRKYPLKLPTKPAPEPPVPHIIYQNATPQLPVLTLPSLSSTSQAPAIPTSPKPAIVSSTPKTLATNGVDVCDGKDVCVDTNPFTSGSSSVNPFDCFLEDIDCGLDIDYADGSDDDKDVEEGLVKDCSDHVSVEDLLEFADQKPCGRQRGVESDEVRIMSKVLKEQVTPEQCLQALELSDWDVHRAIKVIRVKIAVDADISLEECSAELEKTAGDIVKASTLILGRIEIKQ